MNWSLLLIALGLSMDALAVSVAEGVVIKEQKVRHAVRVAVWFAAFQSIMPVVGWLAGEGLRTYVAHLGHWIAFGLLTLIGAKMILEAWRLAPGERRQGAEDVSTLLALSMATSMDALAVGVTLSMLHEAILVPVLVIGGVTFAMSLLGVFIGDRLGHFFESKIEIVAGLVLIAIGLKVLLERLPG
ncbi:MAG: manganese efflux pump MntP family protein [Planctomycetota bacterium]